MANAYQLHATDLARQQKNDEALVLALEVLGMYGATADTGWAQLMKGRAELAGGEYEKAAQTFNAVFGIRAWRGAVSAEAMFRLAETWEHRKDLKKAFAFYQRTYLLYKVYDGGRWAADAYLSSARVLREMGREGDARNTCRAMLLDEYVRDLPQAQVARDLLGPAEVAELLAKEAAAAETAELKEETK